ncbi:hypothetical protein QYE76_017506 [Lolium multiflorum]|uniref:Uncharacterized protein n=1 Tax=Lolium multiflorum TaxID=4521 RepID=A0AAD8QF32_LOLMU|nr:hypothetical protein QYE76_017506 [Lolium multiflorum]
MDSPAAAEQQHGRLPHHPLLAVAANVNGLLVMLSHGLNQDGLYLLDAKRSRTEPTHLSYNLFTPGPVPIELGGLGALHVLWLTGCNLVGSIPSSLGRLSNLNNLEVSTNALTGTTQPEIVALMSSV